MSGERDGRRAENGALPCPAARERLLEAEAEELRGEGDSPVAAHVRSCPLCRRVAGAILEGETALAGALDALGPRRSADELLEGIGGSPEERVVGRRIPWRIAAPTLAAAALAGLVLLADFDGGGEAPGSGPAPSARRAAGAGDVFEVRAPGDRDVMVFDTENPRIKVVWLH